MELLSYLLTNLHYIWNNFLIRSHGDKKILEKDSNRWNPYALWRAQLSQKAIRAYQYATCYPIFGRFEVAFWFCMPNTRRPLRTAHAIWKKEYVLVYWAIIDSIKVIWYHFYIFLREKKKVCMKRFLFFLFFFTYLSCLLFT